MQQNMYINYKGKRIPVNKKNNGNNGVKVDLETLVRKDINAGYELATYYVNKIQKEFNAFAKDPKYTKEAFKDYLKSIKKEIKTKA